MEMKRGKVLCVGSSVVDVLVTYVATDLFDHDSNYVESIGCSTGGDAANEAVVLSRLGHESGLLAAIGTDLMGDFFLDTMEKNKVDTRFVFRNGEYPTTVSIVLVQPNGERNFIVSKGSNSHFKKEYIDFSAVRQMDAVSIASFFTNPELDEQIPLILRAAKEAGAVTTGDMIYRPGCTLDQARAYLPYFDFIFPNYDEAAQLTQKTELEDIAAVLLSCGVKNVVIKIGKRGCFIKNGKESLIVPTYRGAKVVDTTGAGDNFAAGFISGLLEGKSIPDAAAFANATASVAIESVGATGLSGREQVIAMMKSGFLGQ